MVDDPKTVTKRQLESWARDLDSWDVCDGFAYVFVDKTPYAYDLAMKWSSSKHEFVKRAAFATMAGLAVHDKKAPDADAPPVPPRHRARVRRRPQLREEGRQLGAPPDRQAQPRLQQGRHRRRRAHPRFALKWSSTRHEFTKRAAFATMAGLAVHDKKAPDERLLQFLPVIEREAGDDRNFVRKAVNWALRQIGKRNLACNKAAIASAERIHATGTKSGRWIASDALRELRSDAVQSGCVHRRTGRRSDQKRLWAASTTRNRNCRMSASLRALTARRTKWPPLDPPAAAPPATSPPS